MCKMTFVRSFSFLTDRTNLTVWSTRYGAAPCWPRVLQGMVVFCGGLCCDGEGGGGGAWKGRVFWGTTDWDPNKLMQLSYPSSLPYVNAVFNSLFYYIIIASEKKHIPLFYLLFFQKIHVAATSNYQCHHHG